MMAAALFVLLGCVSQLVPSHPPERPEESPMPRETDERFEVKPAQLWAGVLPDESLRRAAPADGMIVSQPALEEVWTAWRTGEETPKIDFKKYVVLVGTIDGPNRMFAGVTNDRAGNLKVMYGGTKVFGPGFGYVLSKLPRKGVKTVNGRPLPKPGPAAGKPGDEPPARRNRPEGEFARVTIQGQLETGIAAIGGETTGTIVRANGMVFELEVNNARLAGRAERLNGKLVIVTGPLAIREGVERGPRLIVTVESLAAAASSRRSPAAPSPQGQR